MLPTLTFGEISAGVFFKKPRSDMSIRLACKNEVTPSACLILSIVMPAYAGIQGGWDGYRLPPV